MSCWGGCAGGGRLELILVLPDGSHLMVPAAWTDLQATPALAEAGTLARLTICSPRDEFWSRCSSVSSWPSAMIGIRGSIVQLRLELAESPAPAVALWELVGEEQRQTAMTLLAALIARTVVGEPDEEGTAVGE